MKAPVCEARGNLEREKAILAEPPQRTNLKTNLNSSELTATQNDPQAEALIDQVASKFQQSDPCSDVSLHLKKGEKGESSEPTPRSPSPMSRNPIACKFCGQQFSTTQALGGHQNAHKQEREMQKAMKAANEYGTTPFVYHLPGTRTPLLHGSYYGHHFHYPPYHGYAYRGWQARPIYSNPRSSIVRAPPDFARTLGGFIGPSSLKSVTPTNELGWSGPYVYTLGPIRRPTNFDSSVVSNNLTPFLQVRDNECGPTKRQCVDSTSLNLSLRSSESVELDLPHIKSSKLPSHVNSNETGNLDLTLKL